MISRRNFIRCVGVFLGALVALPARMVQAKSLAIPLAKAKKLEEAGGSMILKLKGKKVLFIRDTGETIHAVDPICTHKGCTVGYNKKANRIDCPCHGSAFNIEGGVVNGPAKKPLKAYDAKLDGDRIILALE